MADERFSSLSHWGAFTAIVRNGRLIESWEQHNKLFVTAEAATTWLRDQIDRYDMRLTVGLRTPRNEADLPRYEAAVKACAEMDGRVVCVHDSFSGRRYEQCAFRSKSSKAPDGS